MIKENIYLRYTILLILLFFTINSCKKNEDIQKSVNKGPVFNSDLIYDSVKDIDGNTYKTITINNQTWMAENLKTTKFNDGLSIPNITERSTWNNLTSSGYCWYNNTLGYKDQVGAYYNWYSINTGKLCPVGWHIPSDNEWHQMALFLDSNAIININPGWSLEPFESQIDGGKLKEAGFRHWPEYQYIATNETGFTALPAGIRDAIDFSFYYDRGYFWTSTLYGDLRIWCRYLTYYSLSLYRDLTSEYAGLSVRCVKN
jgi:uncharacterized protein (TIGR02145 family)